MRLVRKPKAWQDIVEIGEYLTEADPAVAHRFLDAIEYASEILLGSPRIGSIRISDEYGVVRMWPVGGFENYLIFYKEIGDELTIVRILHSARDYTRFI